MTTPSPHAVASAFVAEHLVDWIAPHGPVMVGDVRTTATGVLVKALADLLVDYAAKQLVEHDRKWLDNHGAVLAQAQRPKPTHVKLSKPVRVAILTCFHESEYLYYSSASMHAHIYVEGGVTEKDVRFVLEAMALKTKVGDRGQKLYRAPLRAS